MWDAEREHSTDYAKIQTLGDRTIKVAIVLYVRGLRPCLRAFAVTPFPSSWMIPDWSSPSRVRFAASSPGPLRGDPGAVLFTRERATSGPYRRSIGLSVRFFRFVRCPPGGAQRLAPPLQRQTFAPPITLTLPQPLSAEYPTESQSAFFLPMQV